MHFYLCVYNIKLQNLCTGIVSRLLCQDNCVWSEQSMSSSQTTVKQKSESEIRSFIYGHTYTKPLELLNIIFFYLNICNIYPRDYLCVEF